MNRWGQITYVGHATTAIELAGARFLTDPVLRGRLGPLRRRGPTPSVAAPDVVLISHTHRDHLDLQSLRDLGPDLHLVGPRGIGNLLRGLDVAELTEVDEGDQLAFGEVIVGAVPAVHDARRDPMGPRTPSLGFVLGGERRIYFAGDTALYDGMASLGSVEVALVPIWGWGPTIGEGHMDPAAAAEALSLIRPRIAIPIHWGTLYPWGLARLRPGPLREPPRRFVEEATRIAPDVEVHVLAPGTSVDLVG